MSWYWWVLLWAVIVVGSLAVLGVLVRSLWGKFALLGQELQTAEERLTAVSEQLEVLSRQVADPAVFTPASQLRQERHLDRRRAAAYARLAVPRAEQIPGSSRSQRQRVR